MSETVLPQARQDGRLIGSWGEPGSGPGQFRVPHGIAVDVEGVVYVADRENSRVQRFSTITDFQTRLKVEVFQGEHAHCSKNQKIGEYEVRDIPRNRAGEENVDVRFTYDMNGVLDVDATVVSTGKTAAFTIERSSGRLTQSELAEVRKRLSRLKFHPRDALPNVTALNRADALYVELVGSERARLGQCLAAFRVALEEQDAAMIGEVREQLLGLLRDLGR